MVFDYMKLDVQDTDDRCRVISQVKRPNESVLFCIYCTESIENMLLSIKIIMDTFRDDIPSKLSVGAKIRLWMQFENKSPVMDFYWYNNRVLIFNYVEVNEEEYYERNMG